MIFYAKAEPVASTSQAARGRRARPNAQCQNPIVPAAPCVADPRLRWIDHSLFHAGINDVTVEPSVVITRESG